MSTFASVSAAGADAARIDAYQQQTAAAFAELEKTLSIFKPDSEVSRVNQAAGVEPVPVAPDTVAAVRLAILGAERSGGAFDPTVRPLMRLWGLHGGIKPEALPDPAAVAEAARLVGYEHVVVRDATVFLDRKGMSLDLGGVAKGFAVDVAFGRLIAGGATNVMVDLGGNMRCAGSAKSGQPWRVGVRNPFDGDQLLGTMRLTDGLAVATSGNYERFVEIQGRRYAHVMDPRTGRPVEGMAGVTVVAPTAGEADVLSTSLFVAGTKEADTILRRYTNCHALFVPDSAGPMTIVVTPGMRRFFEPSDACRSAVSELK